MQAVRNVPNGRPQSGNTIISLVVACALIGLVELELVALLSMNSGQGQFLWSRMDTITSTNYALAVMGERVRSARNIGELYGYAPPPQSKVVSGLGGGPQTTATVSVDPTQIPVTQIQNGTTTMIAYYFPAEGDPLYGPGGSMSVATWPWGGGPGSPYQLSGSCMIIQVPCFDQNGFPLSLAPAFPGATPLSAVDTYVYNLVTDPDTVHRPGQYDLQMAYFPAPSTLTNMPQGMQPGQVTTVITGLVGPLAAGVSSGSPPTIFQYVERIQNSASSTVNPAYLQNYSGVIVNLEVLNTAGTGGRSAILPVRSEMYLRNNVAATAIGNPPNQ